MLFSEKEGGGEGGYKLITIRGVFLSFLKYAAIIHNWRLR